MPNASCGGGGGSGGGGGISVARAAGCSAVAVAVGISVSTLCPALHKFFDLGRDGCRVLASFAGAAIPAKLTLLLAKRLHCVGDILYHRFPCSCFCPYLLTYRCGATGSCCSLGPYSYPDCGFYLCRVPCLRPYRVPYCDCDPGTVPCFRDDCDYRSCLCPCRGAGIWSLLPLCGTRVCLPSHYRVPRGP